MQALLRTMHDLRDTLQAVAEPPHRQPYRPREVVVRITAPDGTFLRSIRCALGERSEADVADALVTVIGDYATRLIECGVDGKPLNASELLDASLKRDLAEEGA